eukprot:TRINITY_DN2283_c0_g1_i2.p4 TRINITY_DN2283_c0_g1~~TRINITY_DN2283_c0_g1_i2.p4  ORF type:complete len:213 (+),score=18.84 TRINITY_DN2283_c0_g1_i2:2023-2661(+)
MEGMEMYFAKGKKGEKRELMYKLEDNLNNCFYKEYLKDWNAFLQVINGFYKRVNSAIELIKQDMFKKNAVPDIEDVIFKEIPRKITEYRQLQEKQVNSMITLINKCKELILKENCISAIKEWTNNLEYSVSGWWRWYHAVGIGAVTGGILGGGGAITAIAAVWWCPPCELLIGMGAAISYFQWQLEQQEVLQADQDLLLAQQTPKYTIITCH